LIFYFDIIFYSSSFNRGLNGGMGVESEKGRVWKGCKILGTDEKTKLKISNAFHPALKVLHSFFLDLIFEDA